MLRTHGAGVVEGIAMLAIFIMIFAIAVPRLPKKSDKEALLRKDLTFCRAAIQVFYDDTKLFPVKLSDLASQTAPETGLNIKGEEVELGNWHGPYLNFMPLKDKALRYETMPPHVGTVDLN